MSYYLVLLKVIKAWDSYIYLALHKETKAWIRCYLVLVKVILIWVSYNLASPKEVKALLKEIKARIGYNLASLKGTKAWISYNLALL